MLTPADTEYTFSKNLEGEDGGKAKDVSGIACIVRADGQLRCLLVNDENRTAQFIEIDRDRITPRETVTLIGKEPPADTVGTPPERPERLRDTEEGFGEFDGEGVAFEAPYFYVAGSHGCSRKHDTFQLSSFYLARFRVDRHGRKTGEVETTYRLGEALDDAPTVGDYFTEKLMGKTGDVASNGLNVEGIAVVGGRFYAGLRAPSLDGTAYIVSVGVDDLFAAGRERLKAKPDVLTLEIGVDAGIRDLSALRDGRLLVLTGPAQDQEKVPHKLFVYDPIKDSLKGLGTLPSLPAGKGKAEAITMIGDDEVLVLYDSLKNGAPRAYKIGWP